MLFLKKKNFLSSLVKLMWMPFLASAVVNSAVFLVAAVVDVAHCVRTSTTQRRSRSKAEYVIFSPLGRVYVTFSPSGACVVYPWVY